MKKIWKAIITAVTILAITLIYANTVNAVDMTGRSSLRVLIQSGTGLFVGDIGSADIFCVQSNGILTNYLDTYVTLNVTNHVHIEGNTATFNGKQINNTQNGMMGYILKYNNGAQDQSSHIYGVKYYSSPKQSALRITFRDWAKTIGMNFSATATGYNRNGWSLVNEGKTYANNLANHKSASISDKTDKDKIGATAINTNGTNYIKVGPFKWDYTGKISNIQVLDQNKNAINNVLYGKYVGTELKTSSNAADIISSGTSFYVLVRADSGVSKITKITGKVSNPYEVITADVWTLENGSRQKLVTSTASTKTVNDETNIDLEYNIPLIIDISGYVWEDKIGGKTSIYDDVYHGQDYKDENGTTYDGNDILVEGMKVELKDKNGNVIATTTTDKEGKYKFENIKIADLGNLYVEFTYDGIKYTSVKTFVGSDNSINSKSGEIVDQRKTLNSAFTEITNAGNIESRNQGYSRNASGQVTSTISYKNDVQNYTSTYESSTYNTDLNANTVVTSYSLEDQFKSGNYIINSDGKPEIQYINLGIVEREQPSLAISNDIETVDVAVNGYTHTYSYAQRNSYLENSTAFNVAVKFGNSYTNTYTRAIYPSDVQYSISDANDSNKLKVYVTYAITVRNLSHNLQSEVKELVNYYDKEYTIVDSWLGDNQANKVNWTQTSKYGQKYDDGNYVSAYTTALAGTKIAAGSNAEKVYIKFQVSDNSVLGLLNANATLDNVAEIYSYSTYYSEAKEGCQAGEIYAAIDQVSAPGNAKPGDNSTYEADTDKSPTLILEATGVREIEGTVFEDSTSENLQSEEARLGDGVYKDGEENTVSGVTVELIKTDGSQATIYPNSFVDGKCVPNKTGEQAITTTGTDGYYIFKGVEPGEYLIKYTYANGVTKIYNTSGNEVKDVTVQNYKSTILTSSNIINAFNNGDLEWFKKDTERYSDARDNYTQREEIDSQMESITTSLQTELDKTITDGLNYTGELKTTLEATSPNFDMGVEYESVYTASTGEAYTYRISNLDFGIVERPRQSVELRKDVSYLKVTLPNGQILIDGNPNDEKLDYVIVTDDVIYVTIDSELLYGSQIEINYDLVLTNTSELDYREESYYYYGKVGNENNIVKIGKATMLDYVDPELIIKENDENGVWTAIQDVKTLADKGITLTEEQRETLLKQYSSIVTAEAIAENTTIKPGESTTTNISVEKLLATSDDLSYENNGEVVTVSKTGGGDITTKIASYAEVLLEDIEAEPAESDETKAIHTVTIIPPTGSGDTITYIIVGLAALVTLGVGAFVVRKIVKL